MPTAFLRGAWPVAVLLALGATAHTAWVLEAVLGTGLDPLRTYVSELAAADQPFGGLFRATDLVAGLLVLAGALWARRTRVVSGTREAVRVNSTGSFIRIGGSAHHVVVEGSGAVCVLSAGLGMSWFDWDPVVPLLAPFHTVVRFDRPGHGLSAPAPAAPPTAAGEAHRIAALLDVLSLDGAGDPERPVTVVGHSVAGFHAEAFARLYPARTASIVLVDSSVEERARTPAAPALRTAAGQTLGTALSAAGVPAALGPLARRAMTRAARASPAGSGGDPAPAELVRRCYRTSRVLRGALRENIHYRAVAAELLALRERAPLPEGVPVTVVAAYDGRGGRGSLRWLERQRGLARLLGGRFQVAEPSGHLVMLDRPDAVVRAVRAVQTAQAVQAVQAVRSVRDGAPHPEP